MTTEEYLARSEADEGWAPGWAAIDAAFAVVYPGVEPAHLASLLPGRATFGGDEYLDGVSFFPSPAGYQHLVSYGMSALYADVGSLGAEHSGWGYEMTMKVAAADHEECGWAASVLSNLARYTYGSKRWFEPYQVVSGRGQPIKEGSDSLLTSFLVVPDTTVDGTDTLHGRLDFLQLVGITQTECDAVLGEDPAGAGERARLLARRLAESGDPHLVTDLARTVQHI